MGTRYNHLSESERLVIYKLIVERKTGLAEVARLLGRHRSTISRELKRNGNLACPKIDGLPPHLRSRHRTL